MNKSGNSFNFETITPNNIDEQLPELYLIEPNDNVPVLLNEHIIAPDRHSNDKSTRKKSKFFIKFLVLLNIIAVVLFYFRHELFLSSVIETTPNDLPRVVNNAKPMQNEGEQKTKDHSSIVSDVLTDIASLEKARKSDTTKKVKASKAIANNTKKTPVKPQKAVRKAKAIAKSAPKKAIALKPAGISGDDIRNILDSFVKAFTNGDSNTLLSLFNDGSESSVSLKKIRSNVDALFANSASRKLSLNNMVWQYQGDKTIGNGKYQASAELNNNRGQQSINADVKIVILKAASQYYIADFQLSKVETKISTTSVPSVPLNPTAIDAMAPSHAELQILVKKFVSAYKAGDIEAMSSLFADNAVTNTRAGLAEIRQDYIELFKTSSERSVFLKGLSWVYSKNHAKGTGGIDVFVTAVGGEIDHVIKGKIKIIAKRMQDAVVITHLYHSESN